MGKQYQRKEEQQTGKNQKMNTVRAGALFQKTKRIRQFTG
jgi:hypothetical protein